MCKILHCINHNGRAPRLTPGLLIIFEQNQGRLSSWWGNLLSYSLTFSSLFSLPLLSLSVFSFPHPVLPSLASVTGCRAVLIISPSRSERSPPLCQRYFGSKWSHLRKFQRLMNDAGCNLLTDPYKFRPFELRLHQLYMCTNKCYGGWV